MKARIQARERTVEVVVFILETKDKGLLKHLKAKQKYASRSHKIPL